MDYDMKNFMDGSSMPPIVDFATARLRRSRRTKMNPNRFVSFSTMFSKVCVIELVMPAQSVAAAVSKITIMGLIASLSAMMVPENRLLEIPSQTWFEIPIKILLHPRHLLAKLLLIWSGLTRFQMGCLLVHP